MLVSSKRDLVKKMHLGPSNADVLSVLRVVWPQVNFQVVPPTQAHCDNQPYPRMHKIITGTREGEVEGTDYAAQHTLRVRLLPGEVAVFNNRRMLHGRDAFQVLPLPC